jgi:hypothetical protein
LVFVILGSCLLLLLHVEDGDAVLHTVHEVSHNKTNRANFDQNLTRLFPLGDLDSVKNMSMSYNSNIDYLLLRGDVDGNLQFETENLPCMRRLSKSDPDIRKSLGPGNTLKKHSGSTLSRQATWHKLLSSPPVQSEPQKVIQQERDLLVIDQMTSTV